MKFHQNYYKKNFCYINKHNFTSRGGKNYQKQISVEFQFKFHTLKIQICYSVIIIKWKWTIIKYAVFGIDILNRHPTRLFPQPFYVISKYLFTSSSRVCLNGSLCTNATSAMQRKKYQKHAPIFLIKDIIIRKGLFIYYSSVCIVASLKYRNITQQNKITE